MINKTIGPNVQRLIARKMALIAIPPGGGIGDGLAFLQDKEKMVQAGKDAATWVHQAIQAIKCAPDNRWGDDDEAIAAEILRRIAEADNREREKKAK